MNKNNPPYDEELFLLIKESDTIALKILFNKYYESLCHFVFTIVGDADLSKEIVSDVFVKIWEKRESITIKYKVKNYLFSSSKNQALNYIHKKKLITQPIDPFYELEATVESDPEEILVAKEGKKRIESLVKLLPNKRKIIFQMKRFDGFTYEEISDILSISIQTVRNQMVKAVKFLSEEYPKLK